MDCLSPSYQLTFQRLMTRYGDSWNFQRLVKTFTQILSSCSFWLQHIFYFSGWGKTIGGGTGAEVLQEAMLPVAYHKTCREKMKVVRKVHKGTMLCAGGQGKGGCQVKKCRYHLYLTNKFVKIRKQMLRNLLGRA